MSSRLSFAMATTLLALVLGVAGAVAAPTGLAAKPPDTRVAGIDVDATTIPELQKLMNAHRLTSVQLTQFYLHRISKLNPILNAVITVSPTALADARAADKDPRRLDQPAAARHPDHRQGQHQHDRHGDDCRLLGAGGQHARRCVHRPATQVGRRGRDREGQSVGVGQLPIRAVVERLERDRGPDEHGLRPRSQPMRLELGLGRQHLGRPRGRGCGHRDRRFGRLPLGRQRQRRHQADSRPPEPGRHRPDLGRPGHRRADGPQHDRRRGASGSDDRRRSRRSGDGRSKVGTHSPTTPGSSRRTRSGVPGSESGARTASRSTASRSTRTSPRSWTRRLQRSKRPARPSSIRPTSRSATGPTPSSRRCCASSRPTSPRYLKTYTGPGYPKTLQDLIDFNNDHPELESGAPESNWNSLVFDLAQETNGRDADCAAQRAIATPGARAAIDGLMAAENLDAIIAPTNSPAWVTDPVNGDLGGDFSTFIGSSGPPAVAGYPNVTVPAGFVGPLPVGVSFIGGRWDEPTLIGLAYAFEQATHVRVPPEFIPSIGDDASACASLRRTRSRRRPSPADAAAGGCRRGNSSLTGPTK